MDLITCLRNGDKEAFNTTFHDYYKYVYTVAYSILKDVQLAQDITQDVFVALWERKHKLKPEVNLAGHLRLTARNKAIDLQRHRAFDVLVLDTTEEPIMPYDADSALEDEKLNVAIDQLPKKYKSIILLKYRFGKSVEQISQSTGLTMQTVSNYTYEAITILRKKFKHEKINFI